MLVKIFHIVIANKSKSHHAVIRTKITKAVKHLNCPSRNVNNKAIASMSLEESAIHEPGKKGFVTAQQRKSSQQQTIELKCFICGNKTKTSNNENDHSVNYVDYYKDKSHHTYVNHVSKERTSMKHPAIFSPHAINKYLK